MYNTHITTLHVHAWTSPSRLRDSPAQDVPLDVTLPLFSLQRGTKLCGNPCPICRDDIKISYTVSWYAAHCANSAWLKLHVHVPLVWDGHVVYGRKMSGGFSVYMYFLLLWCMPKITVYNCAGSSVAGTIHLPPYWSTSGGYQDRCGYLHSGIYLAKKVGLHSST